MAIFAYKGLTQIKLTLEQLKLTREIAKTNAKREAYKLAAEQCGFFAEKSLPSGSRFVTNAQLRN